MEKVLPSTPETNAIRQRMEEVRCDLDEDVQEIVEGARDMGAWRYYVKTFPWVCLGAAVVAGYLIVPRRPWEPREPAPTSNSLGGVNSLPKRGVCDRLLVFAGNLVLRGVLSYVGQQAGKFFASHTDRTQQDNQP